MTEQQIIACAHCHKLNRVPLDRPATKAKCGSCGEKIFSSKPIVLSSANFQAQILKSGGPVLVDFWASWCGPCQMMAPVLDQAASQLTGTVRIAKVDTEAEPQLSQQYGIRSIPSLLLFRHGREIDRLAGATSLPQLLGWIQQHLG